jgi:uncharacterized protein (TIGR03437 family)
MRIAIDASMRGRIFWLCTAFPALAQFAELATNADGSQVYFTTSLIQHETQQAQGLKLFRLSNSGLALLSTESCDPVRLMGACGIGEVQVTNDDALIAYQSRSPCHGGSSCIFRELSRGTLVTARQEDRYSGRIRISRNGRFLVQHDTSGSPASWDRISRLYNLETKTVTELEQIRMSGGLAVRVSDEGTVLMSTGMFFTSAGNMQVPLPEGVRATDMDSHARFVLTENLQRRRLYVTDSVARRSWQIGPDSRESYDGSISADGQWVLYTSVIGSTPQLFFSRVDGSEWRQLTRSGEGVQDSALSHDGRVAFVLTGHGSILRIDTSSGATQLLVGPTPRDLKLHGGPAPGSLNILTGIGLSRDHAVASPPLPAELAAIRLTIDGMPMLLQSVSHDQIVFQIPWELPVSGAPTLLVLSTGNEYFETSIPISLSGKLAVTHAIVHQDFKSLVTRESPARPGEILHLYVTGLGPTEPAVASGLPTPLGEPFVITAPWEFLWPRGANYFLADVLFAGLAPGMIGVYQMDLRLPTAPDGEIDLWAKRPAGVFYRFATIPLRQ